MLFVLAIILFILLVVVHEFGHFIVARRNGVEVEEFGIFFPPRLFVWKRKGDKTEYSLNLLPLGGFVQLKGESDTDTAKGSYGAATLKTKTKIMLAGVGMNLFCAFVIFLGLSLTGMPQIIDNQFSVASDARVIRDYENKGLVFVGRVASGSPAERAGIKTGDEVVAIGDRQIDSPNDLVEASRQRAGETTAVTIRRAGSSSDVSVTFNKDPSGGKGYLGVAAESGEKGVKVVRATWSAPIVAAGTIKQLTQLTIGGLGSLLGDVFRGNGSQAADQVTGPVGIVRILKDNASAGLGVILWLIAYLSLTLAIMNLLPIPALDGGKLYTTLVYRALRRRLTPKAEKLIYGSSFAFLLLLFVLITYIDVRR